MVDVFISYPRSARAKVESIKAKLDELDLDCFFDLESIDGGASFPDIIDRALRASRVVLCCWSPLYFERPWCMIECRDGLARGTMVPVSLERFERFAPPADMRHLNYFDLTTWDGADAHEDWNRTLHAIGKLVGRELVPPLKKTLLGLKARDAAPGPHEAVQGRVLAQGLRDEARGEAQIGSVYDATVVRVVEFGAFVNFLGDKEGLVHVSQLSTRPGQTALDVIKQGERVKVNFLGFDDRGKVRLSMNAVHQGDRTGGRLEESDRLRPGSVWRDTIYGLAETACPEMVTIPPGKFLMGAPEGEKASGDDQRPQHEVRIDYTFALGRHVVTFAEWDAAIAAGAKLEKLSDNGWGRERRPVINVSWEDAKDYIAWLNSTLSFNDRADAYRLPSEAEWEYSCRAGATTPFSFGTMISSTQANYDGDTAQVAGKKGEYRGKTTPVGLFPANAFGLHDMHGNVWEWCEDAWNANYYGAPTDGSAWVTDPTSSRRVCRGGDWESFPASVRSAHRNCAERTFRDRKGFRVARTVSPLNC